MQPTIETLKQELPPTLDMLPDHLKNGNGHNGPCPKCGGTDRHIVFSDGRHTCRQCGWTGDNVDMYCYLNNTTVKELIGTNFREIFDSQVKPQLPPKAIQYFEKRGLESIVPYLLANKIVGWYAKESCITLALFHAQTGDIVGIQRIPVDGSTKRLWKGSNLTDGVLILEGTVDGPEIVCEGVMDGLSARLVNDDYTAVVVFSASTVKKLRHLKLKNPVLFFDNDEAGQKATEKAAQILPNARTVDWSNSPDGCGDINDLLRGDHQETIHRMVETASPCIPERKATIADTILDINSFCAVKFPDRREYLSPWLKESAIVLITGYRGVGKTFFALAIADAVTDQKTFGPWNCEHPVPVLYLDGEMPPQDIIERANGLKLNTPRKAPLYIYSDAYTNQMGLSRANLADEDWRSQMKQTLLDKGVKVFFVDNLASLASGIDENSKQDWDPINQWFLELRFAGITTVMLHHVNKVGGQRGTSAREDNLDCSIILEPPFGYQPEDGARFIASFSKARVKTSNLHQITDAEFKLVCDDTGDYQWTWGGVKQQARKAVLKMLDDGTQQKEISSALGISKGQVSKIRSKAIKDGILTAKNKLTVEGFQAVKSGN